MTKIFHMKIKLSISALLLGLIFSCGPQKEGAEQKAARMDSLIVTYTALNDSLGQAWDTMIADDDTKMANLKRLIEEITYTNNYDPSVTDSLTTMISQLGALRYDQETMRESNLIDEYDSASMVVVNKITNLAINHPQYESHPLMQELVNDIQESQQMLFLYRVRYDEVAKQINSFIDQHNKELIENDVTQTDNSQKPLFQISG